MNSFIQKKKLLIEQQANKVYPLVVIITAVQKYSTYLIIIAGLSASSRSGFKVRSRETSPVAASTKKQFGTQFRL